MLKQTDLIYPDEVFNQPIWIYFNNNGFKFHFVIMFELCGVINFSFFSIGIPWQLLLFGRFRRYLRSTKVLIGKSVRHGRMSGEKKILKGLVM